METFTKTSYHLVGHYTLSEGFGKAFCHMWRNQYGITLQDDSSNVLHVDLPRQYVDTWCLDLIHAYGCIRTRPEYSVADLLPAYAHITTYASTSALYPYAMLSHITTCEADIYSSRIDTTSLRQTTRVVDELQ